MESLTAHLSFFESTTGTLISSIDQYGILALSAAVFLLGEAAIIVAIILTKQSVLDFNQVILAATIGTLAADFFWFTMGRYFPRRYIPAALRERLLSPTNELITRLVRGHRFLPLLLLRFFIGTRLVFILYLARNQIHWVRFLLYDLIGTVVYLTIIVLIGIQLGDTVAEVAPKFQLITSVLSGLLLFMLLSMITRQIVTKLSQSRASDPTQRPEEKTGQ